MRKALLAIAAITLLGFWAQTFAAVTLSDVTNGREIRGITTPSDASGYAKVSWDGSEFMLHAGFTGLSEPKGDDFYEGWLVRKTPFAFISTGELIKKEGEFHNSFSSSIDYSAYTEYVLTIEPNDGNDAPADHILEGVTTLVAAEEHAKKEHTADSKNIEIDLTGKNFSFSQDEIRVTKGDTVTINFESTGGFHDWVVDEFDAQTERVNEGWKTSVTFIASEAGEFEYYCSVWNHRAQWMIGKLIVEEASHTVKDDIMDKGDSVGTAEMARKESLKATIRSRVVNLSKENAMIVLERVEALRIRLVTLNISDAKRTSYTEVLDLLVEVLEDDVINK